MGIKKEEMTISCFVRCSDCNFNQSTIPGLMHDIAKEHLKNNESCKNVNCHHEYQVSYGRQA